MELSIEQFTPKVLELTSIAEKYKRLEIKGIKDKTGYAIVDEARKDLKKRRVEISKFGKEIRDEAIKFQRDVIAKEKEVIAIIEPIEIELTNKQAIIDIEVLKIKMLEQLPKRKEMLAEIEVEAIDDLLLTMNDKQFQDYYIGKKSEYLEEKDRVLKEQEAELKRQKEIEEAKEQARIEAEQNAKRNAEVAKLEAENKLAEQKRKAENDKLEAKRKLEEQKIKAEQEKQKIIDEQKRKDQERIDEEKQKEQARLDQIENERIEGEKQAKNQKYIKFLETNKYTKTEDFTLIKTDTKIILYKKIDEFNLI